MPYTAVSPELFLGKSVDSGESSAFVRRASGAPPSSLWQRGEKVHSLHGLARGTAIATFEHGYYQDHAAGDHSAIYITQDANGIQVWDQWENQRVSERTIPWHGVPGDEGEHFYVIN